MSKLLGRWYITPTALAAAKRLVPELRGQSDAWAHEWLAEQSEAAHYVRDERAGVERWRGPRPHRLRYLVGPAERGDRPPLIDVAAEHAGAQRAVQNEAGATAKAAPERTRRRIVPMEPGLSAGSVAEATNLKPRTEPIKRKSKPPGRPGPEGAREWPQISVRLAPEVRAEIERVAAKAGRTTTAHAQRVLEQYAADNSTRPLRLGSGLISHVVGDTRRLVRPEDAPAAVRAELGAE